MHRNRNPRKIITTILRKTRDGERMVACVSLYIYKYAFEFIDITTNKIYYTE